MTKTMKDYLVTDLGKIEPEYNKFPGKMYAGTINIDHAGKTGEMMFWLFEPDTQLVPDSMMIWLNGGPGCSSFNCGVMMEHAPVTQPLHDAGYCCLKPTPELFYNEFTWTKITTMLYVEQPIGTGFSYGAPLPETEADASDDIDVFMQKFYQIFTHLKPYDFYIFGESYAGMFVPSFARWIHLQNVKAIAAGDKERHIVPLKGAALGNGWVDGTIQGPATIDYSWYHGLIDKPTRDALHVEWKNCMAKRDKPGDVEPPPFHPYTVQDDCGIMWGILAAAGNPNAYDITTWDPNVDQITFTSEAFYNMADVKKSLHAPTNITWHGCRWGAGRRRLTQGGAPMMMSDHPHRKLFMDNDRPFSVVPYIADVVDAGIPVLVYNGDRDMTTNIVGQEETLTQMEWSGKDKWLDAPRGLWKTNDYPSGWAKEYKNLTFAIVYNSGHMVPYNRPAPAFDLVLRFLQKKSFIDDPLPQIRIKPIEATVTTDALQMAVAPALTSSLSQALGSRNHIETFGVAAVSMIVGFCLAVLMMGYYRPQRRRARYEAVPNVEIET